MARKREASAIDDEDSDLDLYPSSIPVSCTSSESVRATEGVDEVDHDHDHNERIEGGEETQFSAVSSHNVNQINGGRSPGEIDAARPSSDEGLLGLGSCNYPNSSSLNTAMESSSSSSREEGDSGSLLRSADECQDQSKGESDSADSDCPAVDLGNSSVVHQDKMPRSELHLYSISTTRSQPSADDVPGDTSTYSTSFTSALSSVADEVDDHQPTLQLAVWSDCHRMPKLSSSENSKRAKVQEHMSNLRNSVPNKKCKVQQRTNLDLSSAAASTWHSLLSFDLSTAVRAQNFGLVLVRLLLSCADAVASKDLPTAITILNQLNDCASPVGDSMQRVVAYFCEGLRIRIFGKGSPLISGVFMQLSPEDCLSALATLNNVTPYFRFAHFTANEAILEAVEGFSAVHIIDLDIMQGIQWPSLIQSLALRPGGPPRLRLTGVGMHSRIIKDTGRRLKSFAASCNIPFEFEAIVLEDYENLRADVFTLRRGEAVVLNAVVMQHHHFFKPFIPESQEIVLHKVLLSLSRELAPCLVTVVEQESSDCQEASFLGQFIEALDYYAAIFDSLDAAFPRQSSERLRIEMLLFWPRIRNMLCSKEFQTVEDNHELARSLGSWEKRMQMAGFFQIPISACARIQAKLLVQGYPYDGYQLLNHKDRKSLSLGWHDRSLLTISAWACQMV